MPKRDIRFDGLRAIGLLAIILAHVGAPALLFQLRNFDVPLMVLVSGMVFNLSSGTKENYFTYLTKRISRLLFPTWVFLGIFFAFSYILPGIRGHLFPFSRQTVVDSFDLISGIGYVWIIRVFILVAAIMPLFLVLYRKIKNKHAYLLLLGVIYLSYEVLFSRFSSSDFFTQNVIFYILPFGSVAGLGLYVFNAKRKQVILLLLGFTIIFLFFAYHFGFGHFVPTQDFKYPPRIYYLSYALSVSLLLYLLSQTTVFLKIFGSKIMLFLGSSTLWIYLWQIFFVYEFGILQKYLNPLFANFLVEYVGIVILSSITVYIQKKIIKFTINKSQNKKLNGALTVLFLK